MKKTRTTKTMAAAAGLAAALTLTACGGSGADDTGTNASASAPIASASNNELDSAACRVIDNDDFTKAEWTSLDTPDYAILIDQAYPLPEPLGSELAGYKRGGWDRQAPIVPLPGGQVAVNLPDYEGERFSGITFNERGPRVAVYDASGELVSFTTYPVEDKDPLRSVHGRTYQADEDLSEQQKRLSEYLDSESGSAMKTEDLPDYLGYFRTITDGVDVPKESTGKDRSSEELELLAITPDTNDDSVVWVLLVGGTDLYKGTVVQADEVAKPADCV